MQALHGLGEVGGFRLVLITPYHVELALELSEFIVNFA